MSIKSTGDTNQQENSAGKVIAIVNRKGGVGKTSVALALSDRLSWNRNLFRPHAVCAVDLDPQASLSRALLHDQSSPAETDRYIMAVKHGRSIASYLMAARNSRGPRLQSILEAKSASVGPAGFEYDLIANDDRCWNEERAWIKANKEAGLIRVLTAGFEELVQRYSRVIVDCPPGQTVLAEAAIRRADLVLCPTTPDWLSYWGLESFEAYLTDVFDGVSKPPIRYLLTRVHRSPTKADTQDKVIDRLRARQAPEAMISLLLERGRQDRMLADAVRIPFERTMQRRYTAGPKPGRVWPFDKIFSAQLVSAFDALVEAVEGELCDG